MTELTLRDRIQRQIGRNERAIEESRRFREEVDRTIRESDRRMERIRRNLRRAGLLPDDR
jgi:septal ring factor EnvC (AmiA/AmiB activator)